MLSSQPTILIAEDEADVLLFLARAMARIKPHATIIQTVNGTEALQYFQQIPCDLIVSDHRMPVMSGLELLVAVRHISAVPFIMLSADILMAPVARQAGVTEFLNKPLGLATLRNTVLRWLP